VESNLAPAVLIAPRVRKRYALTKVQSRQPLSFRLFVMLS
jgi:hypothetical protein